MVERSAVRRREINSFIGPEWSWCQLNSLLRRSVVPPGVAGYLAAVGMSAEEGSSGP